LLERPVVCDERAFLLKYAHWAAAREIEQMSTVALSTGTAIETDLR
jgi:hypothetical protein